MTSTNTHAADPMKQVVDFCEQRLRMHGDAPEGVGWTPANAGVRYQVMLDLIRPAGSACSLLDFGCGASHLLDYIRRHDIRGIDYHGLDVSAEFIALSRTKYPDTPYYLVDVLTGHSSDWPVVDFTVLNGVFTYKGNTSHDAMFEYCKSVVQAVFDQTRHGVAFNVMSCQVDWERSDLFHMPVDPLLDFLSRNVSRHIEIRHNYGLYEYTVYVYRHPSIMPANGVKRLVDGAMRTGERVD